MSGSRSIKSMVTENKQWLKGAAVGAGVAFVGSMLWFGLRYVKKSIKLRDRMMEEIKRREKEDKNPVVETCWEVLYQVGEVGADGKITDGYLICKRMVPDERDPDEKYCLMHVDPSKGGKAEIKGTGPTVSGAVDFYLIPYFRRF